MSKSHFVAVNRSKQGWFFAVCVCTYARVRVEYVWCDFFSLSLGVVVHSRSGCESFFARVGRSQLQCETAASRYIPEGCCRVSLLSTEACGGQGHVHEMFFFGRNGRGGDLLAFVPRRPAKPSPLACWVPPRVAKKYKQYSVGPCIIIRLQSYMVPSD
ncbi:unnamed protein product [Ectocarpus sp. 12 AP-2014]